MPTISSIPLETLCRIFELLVRDAQDVWMMYLRREKDKSDIPHWSPSTDMATMEEYLWQMEQPPPKPQPYAWTRIAHVCREWRAAALGNPLLWTNVAVISKEATATVIERTAGLPLLVTFDLACENPEVRLLVLRQLLETSPAQVATLVVPLAVLSHLVPSIAVGAAQLRSLLFIEPNHPTFEAQSQAPADLVALERMECIVPLWRPLVSHVRGPLLKTLIITHGSSRTHLGQYFTTLAELTRALVRSPQLEHLDVELDDRMADLPMAVELPKLRVLRLRTSTSVCVAFLRYVTAPRRAQVSMRCELRGDLTNWEAWDLSPIPKAIRETVASSHAVNTSRFEQVVSIKITFIGCTFIFEGWRAQLHPSFQQNTPAPDVEIRISMPSALEDVLEVFSTMPFRDAQVLWQGFMQHRADGTPYDTARALCTLPQLRHVTLDVLEPAFNCELLDVTPALSVAIVRMQCWQDGDSVAKERAQSGTSCLLRPSPSGLLVT